MVRVATLWLVVLTGCATTSGASAMPKGVRRDFLVFDEETSPSATRWHSVQTDDFVLLSDLPIAQLEENAQRLTQTFVGTSALFRRLPDTKKRPPFFFAIADDADFARLATDKIRFVGVSNSEQDVLLVTAGWFTTASVQTQVTRLVLGHHVTKPPRWLAVGMAAFFSTLSWSSEDTVHLGKPNDAAYRLYRSIRSVGVDELRRWNGDESDRTKLGLVGQAWAFVHWALTYETERFMKYLHVLGETDDVAAWRATFGPIEDTISALIYRVMSTGELRSIDLQVPRAPPRSAMVTSLNDDDLKLLEERLKKKD